MNTFNVEKKLCCPACKGGADAASALGHNGPEDGDIAVCAYCGSVNQYIINLNHIELQALSEEELNQIKRGDPDAYRKIIQFSFAIKAIQHD